ncbi:MAG TPA: PLP-dependent aminotransferase family protein [Bryobacteraceae bacterium]|nr:PLP-dependent aminotransferase family protein [Bryobacteraceae bacterium]
MDGSIAMARTPSSVDLTLPPRPAGVTLTRWLYDGIRSAILAGRLRRGARLPPSRELAALYGISRRIVVNAYEQLRDEGYLTGRVGAGTAVSAQVPEDYVPLQPAQASAPVKSRTDQGILVYRRPVRPFHPIEPALTEFPATIWSQVTARVLRRLSTRMLGACDPAGLPALRQAVAEYLGTSRGVACSPDQVVIVSGTQQSLDLLGRILIQPGDPVWVEDPGYVGAVDAFRNARARIVPVRVDEHGLDPGEGRRACENPRAIYLTPAHQFAVGTTMSLERRLDLLHWNRTAGAAIIEDDYDSEFRFSGPPVPALRGLDASDSVFLLGSFNKVLFPSLRLGYMVVPEAWIDRLLALRYQSDRYPPSIGQSVLARFMEEGHFGRHLRRMRELYAERRAALQTSAVRYLGGILRLPEIAAGLNTPAYLENGMRSDEAAERAQQAGVDAWPLDAYCLQRRDVHGLMLGFAAFTEREIRAGVLTLARALASSK